MDEFTQKAHTSLICFLVVDKITARDGMGLIDMSSHFGVVAGTHGARWPKLAKPYTVLFR